MALAFDPQTGFSADDVAAVRAAVAQAWKQAFKSGGKAELNTEPETPAGQIIDSQTDLPRVCGGEPAPQC